MERCPICRGRITPEQNCRRCKADLTLILQTNRDAEALTQKAVECIDKHHYRKAEGLLERALSLKNDPFVNILYGYTKTLS